jgi:hypothetical protein
MHFTTHSCDDFFTSLKYERLFGILKCELRIEYLGQVAKKDFAICEACTVRSILGRELTWTSGDMQLLMLERMRLVNMAHAWALSTLQGTSRYLGRFSNFGKKYGIEFFPKAPITHPPRSAVIPLLWGVLGYTLQTSRKMGEGIKYNTARILQLAASAYHLW